MCPASCYEANDRQVCAKNARSSYSALRHASSVIFTGIGNSEQEDADAVAQKEEFLNSLLEKYPERVKTEDYLVVLRAISSSKLPDAAMRAERWLYRLEQQSAVDQSRRRFIRYADTGVLPASD